MDYQVSVVGLGKLGSCLAASLAYHGCDVIGIDVDEDVVETLQQGQSPYDEPMLQEYLDAAGDHFIATTDYTAVRRTNVTFVFVDTPSCRDGRYDHDTVRTACRSVGRQLRAVDDYHLVVVRSTVMPGTIDTEVRPVLAEASDKIPGEDVGLCYCPEFTAVGEVVSGMERPDFFLIGEDDERAGDVLSSLYREWVDNHSPVLRTDIYSAEIAKMAVNTYISMKISFANTLSQVCQGTGGNVDDVSEILGYDSRINSAYLTGGTRFGGPCFPRDNKAFATLARSAGTTAPLATATDEVNDGHTGWLVDAVSDATPSDGAVGILGLTYKPGVTLVEESQGMHLLESLRGEYALSCWDPNGEEHVRRHVGDNVHTPSTLSETLSTVDTAVVAVRWDELTEASTYRGHNLTVVDPWRIFDHETFGGSVTYVPLGAPISATIRETDDQQLAKRAESGDTTQSSHKAKKE
ncbi:nucleotide sugar dehydrogenase [Haloarcula montana]|uniref:nucleotide sugar dehydrogenase n=1 Tax=Haloarcula montana TaxID=3111776 RepID=UPI002D777F6B|nr:nucleotide sugar dehydrogenase [Haloarcula sp. GH36]